MQSFHNGRVVLHSGDCLVVLAAMADDSVDSVVCDPPYHLTSIVKRFGQTSQLDETHTSDRARRGADGMARLSRGFMGKQWDGGDIAFRVELWAQVLRVLKPGGHLVAFSGTRTYHRMACAIEDAGFEMRDMLQWLYGSGFPKSHDVSKAIDGTLGRQAKGFKFKGGELPTNGGSAFRSDHPDYVPYAPRTDDAAAWQGWGTALKPACEPIAFARKPLSEKTVAANVLAHGVGGINVDACRIGAEGGTRKENPAKRATENAYGNGLNGGGVAAIDAGRWPANLIHDGSDEVVSAFPDTHSAGHERPHTPGGNYDGSTGIGFGGIGVGDKGFRYGDNGGSAARFFYSAKADAEDRIGSKHPTVKPVDLMRWLCRLVTPKGGTVLDMFAGTGTTGAAAYLEGFNAVLIEREPEYQADIARRMALLLAGPDEKARESLKARGKAEGHDDLPLFIPTPAPKAKQESFLP